MALPPSEAHCSAGVLGSEPAAAFGEALGSGVPDAPADGEPLAAGLVSAVGLEAGCFVAVGCGAGMTGALDGLGVVGSQSTRAIVFGPVLAHGSVGDSMAQEVVAGLSKARTRATSIPVRERRAAVLRFIG